MKNIGIICEYNPLHRGHVEQFRIVREKFGQDCRIICLMSGSVVQRGETAIFCKYQRARAAVECGADLVLELPYPYSGSCAEIFARAGVFSFAALGNIHAIAFGSENGDIVELEKIARRLDSQEFENKIAEIAANNPRLSYPKVRSESYRLLYGESLTEKPNDTLGIEYIRAAWQKGISLFTYQRQEGYSATMSRAVCHSGGDRSECLPEKACLIFDKEAASLDKYFDRGMLSFCMNVDVDYLKGVFDMPPTLAAAIVKYAPSCSCYGELINKLLKTNYTRARIKRSILYAYLGVTGSFSQTPRYLNILASGKGGMDYLREIKKTTEMTVISKISHAKKLTEEGVALYRLNQKADRLFCMTMKNPVAPSEYMKKGPFLLED